MDHCKDSENERSHSILCVKLEPFDEVDDCTQNLDPLEPDRNVHTQMELLQDFKTEIESDGSDQAMNELIQQDILKNDPGDTGIKIEEINIKTEYIDNEASALDDLLDSRGIIEDDNSVHNELGENRRDTGHGRAESCESQCFDVINPENGGNAFHATSPVNHFIARSDPCSSGIDAPRIHQHSTSKEEPKQSSSFIAHSLLQPSNVCDVLASHGRMYTGQKPHVSDMCKKELSDPSNLVTLERVHTGQNAYVCDICKKGFSQSSNLVRHKRIHTGQKPYVCDVCKKGFGQLAHLVSHKRIHTGQKPYVCDICKKGFGQSSDLVRHKLIHTGQKPYICDICKKGFINSSNLISHKRSHTGQKPYVCDICKNRFSHSCALVTHKRIHSGQKPYVCDICKKGFRQSSNLISHKRIHHDQKPCA